MSQTGITEWLEKLGRNFKLAGSTTELSRFHPSDTLIPVSIVDAGASSGIKPVFTDFPREVNSFSLLNPAILATASIADRVNAGIYDVTMLMMVDTPNSPDINLRQRNLANGNRWTIALIPTRAQGQFQLSFSTRMEIGDDFEIIFNAAFVGLFRWVVFIVNRNPSIV